MHQNKGITIVSLSITVILLIILASVGVTASIDAFETAKVTAFVSKMNMIQAQVNIEHLKKTNGNEAVASYGQNIPLSEMEKVNTVLNGESSDGFKYFNKADLKNYLNLDGIDEVVIINFDTRKIYSLTGVKYEDEMYYNQYDLPDGQYNIGYSDPTIAEKPEFEIEKLNYGTYTTLNIKNIVYNGNANSGNAYYGVVNNIENDNIEVDYWQEMSNNSATVNKSATYAIKYIDKANNELTKTVDVIIVNEPNLTEGMNPVVFDETKNKWKKIANTNGLWYDYSSKKWANIMLSDGMIVDEDNYVTQMGSMFVWIPRYAYRITSGYHEKNVGEIDIKFLKGTTNIPTDEKNISISNASGLNNWNVHPAFTNGSENNYSNGEWKEEVTGMWVAKFEASSSSPGSPTDPSVTNGGGNTDQLNIKILPNVKSWREISEQNIFNNCRNMNEPNNIYGLPQNAITHQMKNSEWGAVSYLTRSVYGKNTEIYINNSTRFITGNSAGSVDATAVNDIVNTYETESGQAASTTGNIYGVYDLSGGALEQMAAFIQNAGNVATNAEVLTTLSDSDKYLVNIYTNSYISNTTKFGDAIYETSVSGIESNSWNEDASVYISDDYPFICRGGWSENGSNSGIFAYYKTTGEANINYGFRPVIII